MERDDFDRYIEEMPEPKLELVEGRLSVGNGAGNRQLLRHLLEGWGAEAALPMAPADLWWRALHQAFQPFQPPHPDKPAGVWKSWASQLSYTPDVPPAGPMVDLRHRVVRQRLMMDLFGLARDQGFAHVSGGDVIVRLGQNAVTPDVFAVGPERCRLLNRNYLDGPADLAIEILFPGHEAYDRDFKRRLYEAGGVTEYWVVDPVGQTVEFLRREGEGYRPRTADLDGRYRSPTFPGLSFQPALLWDTDDWGRGPNPFLLEAPLPVVPGGYAEGGIRWGDIPFEPGPGLEPRPISFEEFAAWTPEAKFENLDGRPWIGGSQGSRNVLGLLLRTEGLAGAVSVLHPREWISALNKAEEDRAADSTRREQWWQVAREVASLLREKFHFGRLVLVGDLVRPQPLNVWSRITLMAYLPKGRDTCEASRFLYRKYPDQPDIHLIAYKHATRAEQQAADSEGVEL